MLLLGTVLLGAVWLWYEVAVTHKVITELDHVRHTYMYFVHFESSTRQPS